MNKQVDIQKSKKEIDTLIDTLYDLIVKRDDYNSNSGLKDIAEVLEQVDKTIDDTKYPERLISKLVSYIYSMGPAHKIFFPKNQEAILDKLGVIGQGAGNAGLYYASFDTKADFFKGL